MIISLIFIYLVGIGVSSIIFYEEELFLLNFLWPIIFPVGIGRFIGKKIFKIIK